MKDGFHGPPPSRVLYCLGYFIGVIMRNRLTLLFLVLISFLPLVVLAATSKDNPFGINVSLALRYDRMSRDDAMKAIDDLGVGWIREDFNWQDIEPVKGDFRWAKFDEMTNIARQHKVHVLGILGYSTEWASSAFRHPDAGFGQVYPPEDREAWFVYVKATVTRYKSTITHWQVWNEEDTDGFWKPKPDAAAYAKLLADTYAVIKKADKNAVVVMGGVHSGAQTFVSDVLKNGGKFDVLGVHSYGGRMTPPELLSAKDRLGKFSATMRTNGMVPKIWITEMGWDAEYVSFETQAAYLARFFGLMRSIPEVENIFWYELRDDNQTSANQLQYGVMHHTLIPKPAFYAYQQVIQLLSGKKIDTTKTVTSDRYYLVENFEDALPTGFSATKSPWGNTAGLLQNTEDSTVEPTAEPTVAQVVGSLPCPSYSFAGLGFWMKGMSGNAQVFLQIDDASGETLQYAVGSSTDKKWLYHDIRLNAPFTAWGGDENKQFTGRCSAVRLVIVGQGSVAIDQLERVEIITIPALRFTSDNQTFLDMVYKPGSPQKYDYPLPASTAIVHELDGKKNPLPIANNIANLTLSDQPIWVEWKPIPYQAAWKAQEHGDGPLGAFTLQRGTTKKFSVTMTNAGSKSWQTSGDTAVGFYVYKDSRFSVPFESTQPGNKLFGQSIFADKSWTENIHGIPHVRAGLLQKTTTPKGDGVFSFTLAIPSNAVRGWYREDFSLAYGDQWMANPTNGDPMGIAHVWVGVEVE